MLKRNRDILFHIENEVQFDSIRPLMEYIRDNTEITFDVIAPGYDNKKIKGYNEKNKEIHDGGVARMRQAGFEVFRDVNGFYIPKTIQNTEYKMLISAYVYKFHYENINAKYRIMFPYASYYFNKPNWTIPTFMNQYFRSDALISHAIGTKQITDIWTETYVVPMLKFINFKKHMNITKKPIVFYAPTYNEIEFQEKFLDCVSEIKNKNYLIMRGHHRVVYIDEKKDLSQELYEKADEVFDMKDFSIKTPLEKADICVSDNSGAIFDAIYCGVPVVLFSRDPNSYKFREINTIQSKLVERGDILWTDNPKELPKLISKTLTKTFLKKQEKMRKELFPDKIHNINPIDAWMDVINIYLYDQLPYDYIDAKKYWVSRIDKLYNSHTKMNNLEAELHKKNVEIEVLNAKIGSFLSIKRSTRLLVGNIKRKIAKITKN